MNERSATDVPLLLVATIIDGIHPNKVYETLM